MGLTNLKPRVSTIDTRRGGPVAVERIRGRRAQRDSQRIAMRDEYTCRKCGRVTAQGEADHKTPLHLGGGDNDENKQWLCVDCHAEKTKQEQYDRGRVKSLASA